MVALGKTGDCRHVPSLSGADREGGLPWSGAGAEEYESRMAEGSRTDRDVDASEGSDAGSFSVCVRSETTLL